MQGHWAVRLPALRRISNSLAVTRPALGNHVRLFTSTPVRRLLGDDDGDDWGAFATSGPKPSVLRPPPLPTPAPRSAPPPTPPQSSQSPRLGSARSPPLDARSSIPAQSRVPNINTRRDARNGRPQPNGQNGLRRNQPSETGRAEPRDGTNSKNQSQNSQTPRPRLAGMGRAKAGPGGNNMRSPQTSLNRSRQILQDLTAGVFSKPKSFNNRLANQDDRDSMGGIKQRDSPAPSMSPLPTKVVDSGNQAKEPAGEAAGLTLKEFHQRRVQKVLSRRPDQRPSVVPGQGPISYATIPVKNGFGRVRSLPDNDIHDFEVTPEEVAAEIEETARNATPAFPKTSKPDAFYDINALLGSISAQIDTPKPSVLPSVRSREKRGRQKLAKMGYEAMPDGSLRPHPRKRHSNFEDRDRAAENDDRNKWRLEKERRRAEAAARQKNDPVPIILPDFITVANLAAALEVPLQRFIRTMTGLGFDDCRHDHILNAETAGLVAMELGFAPQNGAEASEDGDLYAAPPATEDELRPRPPVVTIMGHVDHGKTTLLDYLRSSAVAAGEHGGITQHIGAFSVPLSSGQTITFLDTPGHAAFLAMRQRGASVTDIVVLVVAADDGVMPQTKEAIKHAREAGVPVIVAINKMDREDANPDRVRGDLAANGIEVEDWGGDTPAVLVSGKTGKGMPDLEDTIITLAEMLDLKADPAGPVEGWIVEAQKRLSGMAATMIVRRGTLKVGDVIIAGTAWARVRTLRNEAGETLAEVGPGCPVEVEGWREQPEAGDEVLQAKDETHASDVVDVRHNKAAKDKLGAELSAMNEARSRRAQARDLEDDDAAAAGTTTTTTGGGKDRPPPSIAYSTETTLDDQGRRTMPFIIKADVDGSVEAVSLLVSAIGNAEVAARVVRSSIGTITRSDIDFAATTGARIISFNVAVPPSIVRDASVAGVGIITETVIYRIDERVRDAVSSLLDPIVKRSVSGEAEVVQSFEIDVKSAGAKKKVIVAGCKVKNGIVSRSSKVRVLRGGLGVEPEVVYDGKIVSLRHVKKEVTEMRKDSECGMTFGDGWEGIMVGDRVQCYSESQEKRRL